MKRLDDDLAAMLAHDIRGPLTSIAGFAELLEEGYLEGAEATDAARTIRLNAQRLAELASDMVVLSRLRTGEKIATEPVDLTDLLRSAIEGLETKREIAADLAAEHAQISGDADLLRSAIGHLLASAVRFTPSGEPVRIELRADGDSYRFAVHSVAGKGIALLVATTILQRHGGRIELDAAPDRVGPFTVLLPAAE